MYHSLSALDIATPAIYSLADVRENVRYCIKPSMGFGSTGITKAKGEKILSGEAKYDSVHDIIQEDCGSENYCEVTAEIFNAPGRLHVFARERVAVKSGVCVKMKPVDSAPFMLPIKILISNFDCPKSFNVQFLYHDGIWKLFDCNLRLGAGTALSTAIGFQLTRAFLADLIHQPVSDDFFRVDSSIKSVLRVYKEVVIR